jgi:hypothetical protein
MYEQVYRLQKTKEAPLTRLWGHKNKVKFEIFKYIVKATSFLYLQILNAKNVVTKSITTSTLYMKHFGFLTCEGCENRFSGLGNFKNHPR